MAKYQRRETEASKVLKGKERIVVSSYHDLFEKLPTIDLERQVLCIEELPIISEDYYLSGDQTPYNRYHKHAPTVKLDSYDSLDERDSAAKPFYRQRRDAFIELNKERKEKLREGDDGLLYYCGLSWRPMKNEDPRIITLLSAFKGLEGFLRSYHSNSPLEKTRIRAEYSPRQSRRQGAKVKYSIPSVTGDGWYAMDKNSLHNVAVFNNPQMYRIMSRIWSSHMSGEKDNMLLRFGDIGNKNRPIRSVPLDQQDVQALLQFMYESQARFRAGENIDSVYDPLERTWATIPMFLNPIPLATPNELHEFRVLYHNTVISRPKRDRRRGGFLKDPGGNVIYDKEKVPWEAEIEPIMWTRISDLEKDAMFVRQRVIDLPFFER